MTRMGGVWTAVGTLTLNPNPNQGHVVPPRVPATSAILPHGVRCAPATTLEERGRASPGADVSLTPGAAWGRDAWGQAAGLRRGFGRLGAVARRIATGSGPTDIPRVMRWPRAMRAASRTARGRHTRVFSGAGCWVVCSQAAVRRSTWRCWLKGGVGVRGGGCRLGPSR